MPRRYWGRAPLPLLRLEAQIGVLLPQSRPLKSEAFPPSDRPYMYGTDCESSERIITAQQMKNGYITIMTNGGVMRLTYC